MKDKIRETIRFFDHIGVIDGLKLGLAIVAVLVIVPALIFGCGSAHHGPERVGILTSVESVSAEQAEIDGRLEELDRTLTLLEHRVAAEKPEAKAGRCEIKRCEKF